VRRDGADRDVAFVGPVAPEESVGARRAVLDVGLEHLAVLLVRVLDRVELVGLQSRLGGFSSSRRTDFSTCLNNPSAFDAFAFLSFERFASEAEAAAWSFGAAATP
jgi:hypothetical protein